MSLRDYACIHLEIPKSLHEAFNSFEADYSAIPPKLPNMEYLLRLPPVNPYFKEDELLFIKQWYSDESDNFYDDTPKVKYDLDKLLVRIKVYQKAKLKQVKHNKRVDSLREIAKEVQFRYFMADQMLAEKLRTEPELEKAKNAELEQVTKQRDDMIEELKQIKFMCDGNDYQQNQIWHKADKAIKNAKEATNG